jgi:hypothetical protein
MGYRRVSKRLTPMLEVEVEILRVGWGVFEALAGGP